MSQTVLMAEGMNGAAPAQPITPREDLFVPDRFEGLRDAGSGSLKSIIVPVGPALDMVASRFEDLRAARRGGFMLLRGDTGAGKSTFLDTVGMFLNGVSTERVAAGADTIGRIQGLTPSSEPRVVVLENREALGQISHEELESVLHAVNAFVRSDAGHHTLVVWPTNTDELTELLRDLGLKLGGEALFGIGEPVTRFNGPGQAEFPGIAERTVAALNEGASLAALGISEERAQQLAEEAATVGSYLAVIRQELLRNGAQVRKLLPAEQFRLWTIVIAGNDPDGDVAALTRGGYAYADIDRLMTATGANVVKELKKHPDALGILGTVLDAKILHVDRMTILAVAREFGDATLHALMKAEGMSTSPDPKAIERLATSELGLILAGESLGTRRRGSKPGGGTEAAFTGLAKIARDNDGALNRALGAGLVAAGLATGYESEKELGTELKYTSDLYVSRGGDPVRLEVMWRTDTSRAEIANYVLGKLGNYGKAIGLLS